MTILRGYQDKGVRDTYEAWDNGKLSVMYRLACGMGKTPVIGRICDDHDGWGVVTAHRAVLVTQISQQLAREGIRHRIIGSEATKKQARDNHLQEFGKHFVDPHAGWHAASVDTLYMMNPDEEIFRRSTRFIGDESHHFLRMNKWGKAWNLFKHPDLRTFLPTATPARADGMGLGSHADGIADVLIEGPDQKWGIDNGYLTGYRIWCPTAKDLDLNGIDLNKEGDFNQNQLAKAMAKSTAIVGDVVSTYIKHAMGKLGVTFAVNVEEANKIAAEFNRRGVPAAVLDSKTSETERNRQLKAFEQRKLWQLVNVDLFGEGFDLPAIECVSMARPTASWPLFVQQFNRALRLMISRILMNAWDTYPPHQRKQFIAESPKPFAMIFDHVGNTLRHGLPDKPRVFSLDRRAKRSGPSDAIPTIACDVCENPYEIIEDRCPYCGAPKPVPDPSARSGPNLVGGDIFELTPDVIAKMLGDASSAASAWAPVPEGVQPYVAEGIRNRARTKAHTQKLLRHYVGWWCGLYPGDSTTKLVRRFYYEFNIDMLSAFALKTADAETLLERVKLKLDGIVINDLDYIHQPQQSA
jgi:superfamily II DNA or RNA helicase